MASNDTGRCDAFRQPDGSVRWRVWAPRAKRVDLVLTQGEQRRCCAMSPEQRGFFHHTEAGIVEGQRYAYRLDGGPERPDPASLWQPDGVHRPSAVLFPENFRWSDQAWRDIPREELVFYELHVGTFSPEGTFEAVIPRLRSLRDLGITAIELMPVAQFPGARNWGYDGVHLYAPQNSYGGPHGLQRLVEACHREGLAIFLDVVYNHLGPEGNYLHEFGPYFSDRYRTFWGPAFNYDSTGCDAARDFILNNARLWIGAYHFDGLRLDAVHAIYDAGARHILREIKEVADETARGRGFPAYVIAESNLNDVRLLVSPERGGYGLDAQWNDDFHHAVHTHLTGERQGYYMDFGSVQDFPRLLERTFLFEGQYSRYRERRHGGPVGELSGDRFVISIQNHDQVGNRARGERLSALIPPAAQRLAASMMLLAPHLPLLFMGEEYAEEHPFLFFCDFSDQELVKNVREGRRQEFESFNWHGDVPDPQAERAFTASRLTWSWPEGTVRAGMRCLYHDLLAARRQWPALKDFVHRAARVLPDSGAGVSACPASVLELVRGRTEGKSVLRAYLNLTDQSQPLPQAAGPGEGLLFSSEWTRYGGQRAEGPTVQELLPYECITFGSATE